MVIIDVISVIPIIANGVFPEASLPDASFAFGGSHLGTPLGGGQFLHEADFDGFPAVGKIDVVRRQRPHAVHMVRQHHPGVYVKGSFPFGNSHRIAQHVECRTNVSSRRSSKFTVKKYVPPGTRYRR